MKKLFYPLITILLLASCSAKEDIDVTSSNEGIAEITKVYDQIDSINAVYSTHIAYSGLQTRLSRKEIYTWLKSHVRENVADAAGGIVGGWIGRSVGAAVGSATGNPVAAVGGYIGGRYVGRIAGSVAASYAAHRIFSNEIKQDDNFEDKLKNGSLTKEDIDKLIKSSTDIEIKDIKVDPNDSTSIGYIHNQILLRLLENNERYTNPDGSTNIDLVLEDCAQYAEEIDSTQYDASTLSGQKEILKQQVSVLANEANNLKSDDVSTINIYYSHIQKKIPGRIVGSIQSLDRLSSINTKISPLYNELRQEDLSNYKKDIDNSIENSKLSSDVKSELLISNSIIANSTLLWKTINATQSSTK